MTVTRETYAAGVLTHSETVASPPPLASVIDVARDFATSGPGLAAAFTAAGVAAQSGPVDVVLRPGTYRATNPLLLADIDGLRIFGEGATLLGVTTSTHVLQLLNCRRFKVEGLRLHHAAKGVRVQAADGLNVKNCTGGRIEGVEVGFVRSIGIRVAASQRITVRDCTVLGSHADGIGVYTDFRRGGANASIKAGSTALSCPDGATRVSVADVGSVVIIPGAGPDGGLHVTTIAAVTGPFAATLTDAAVTSVSAASIKIGRGCSDIRITGNAVADNGDDAYSVVGYDKAGTDPWPATNERVVVAGNIANRCAGRGVAVIGCDNFTVTNNIVTRSQSSGLSVTWANVGTQANSNGILAHNVLTGTVASGGPEPAIRIDSTNPERPITNVVQHDNVTA